MATLTSGHQQPDRLRLEARLELARLAQLAHNTPAPSGARSTPHSRARWDLGAPIRQASVGLSGVSRPISMLYPGHAGVPDRQASRVGKQLAWSIRERWS